MRELLYKRKSLKCKFRLMKDSRFCGSLDHEVSVSRKEEDSKGLRSVDLEIR